VSKTPKIKYITTTPIPASKYIISKLVLALQLETQEDSRTPNLTLRRPYFEPIGKKEEVYASAEGMIIDSF
jgi:hypothetical protein